MGTAPTEEETEKVFGKKMQRARWHTYRDEETGRLVTNAYPEELVKIEQIVGIECEIVSAPLGPGCCARIGPKLRGEPQ